MYYKIHHNKRQRKQFNKYLFLTIFWFDEGYSLFGFIRGACDSLLLCILVNATFCGRRHIEFAVTRVTMFNFNYLRQR